jgi:hypothetical protein
MVPLSANGKKALSRGSTLTAQFNDLSLNHTPRNHPLLILTPMQTHEVALETAEKTHVGVGWGFDLRFIYFPLCLSDRSVNAHANFKSKPHQLQHGFPQPFEELIGRKFDSFFFHSNPHADVRDMRPPPKALNGFVGGANSGLFNIP